MILNITIKAATIIPFLILILGFTNPSKQTIINGKIKIDRSVTGDFQMLSIELRNGNEIIGSAGIRGDSTFSMSVEMESECDLFYYGMGIEKTYLQTIKPTDTDTLYLSMKIPNKYEKNGEKVICPKCHKPDQTIPIAYGLKTIIVFQDNPPPYTTYEEYGRKEVFDGGCNISEFNPKYYCKRDKIRF